MISVHCFCFFTSADRLNDEARKLITDLGSTYIRSVGFRDSWVFLGKKGATSSSRFEKVQTHAHSNKRICISLSAYTQICLGVCIYLCVYTHVCRLYFLYIPSHLTTSCQTVNQCWKGQI